MTHNTDSTYLLAYDFTVKSKKKKLQHFNAKRIHANITGSECVVDQQMNAYNGIYYYLHLNRWFFAIMKHYDVA